MFVNETIDKVINLYLLPKDNIKEKEQICLKILNVLIKIYGDINITNPFILKNENSLYNNLQSYGANINDINNLFNLMDQDDLTNQNIIIKIDTILSNLIILKNQKVLIDETEMQYYNNYFKNNNTINIFNEILNNSLEKAEDKPILLSKELYEAHGLTIEEVEKLPDETIININNKIMKLESDNKENPGGRVNSNKKLILTSGNGFIDALVLLGIMCTELMIGIVITIFIARFK